jgi:hypothetical protein
MRNGQQFVFSYVLVRFKGTLACTCNDLICFYASHHYFTSTVLKTMYRTFSFINLILFELGVSGIAMEFALQCLTR